ncbi:ABC transporter permease [Sphingobacterium thalpophilum]|uniref:Lipoprotein-releasing system transmembrane protein lolE n=1 Tax=Sphingobacterium thalpophilum TaxID=259 RepID=A0A4U9VLA8_9SPHI|nr:FtsX-like permease family protein [Sphingobacterium thalpophilum]VTR47033.1 Lipoprotein-releasing system transmembrane protein lolE [Sphingobacterium thalpophilum]
MNFPYFLAHRIAFSGKRTFSKLIVRVTIGAIALAIAAIVISIAVLRGFKGEIISKQRDFFADVLVLRYDLNKSYENSPISLTPQLNKAILGIPQVYSINSFATKAGIINVNDEVEGVILKGIDSLYDQQHIKNMLVDGSTMDFKADNVGNQILVSKYLADRLMLKVGDDFIMYFVQEPIRKRKFVIKGIFNTGSEELDKVYVIGSLDIIRKLSNLDDNEVGGYEIRINDFNQLERTTAQIEDMLPIDMQAINIKDRVPDIFQWLDLLDMNTKIIFILMTVVAIINMISALLITILERTSMIGILKALGYHNAGIRQVFMYSALYLIGLGLVIGNLIGLGFYFFQDYTHFFKLDQQTYYIAYVAVKLYWSDVILVNLSVVLIGMISLFIPSMLITKISPIKAISFK